MRFATARRLMRLHWPVLMLGVATVCWGMGFSWAKNVGDAINAAAGRGNAAAVGPMTGLMLRFATAAVLWAIVSPASRRGWTRQTVRRSAVIGGMLSLGLALQHLGLGASDEATTAFLTNLTVVLVPLGMVAVTHQLPGKPLMAAIPVALFGMLLFSGVDGSGSTAGVVYGIACAAAFAAEILLLDRVGRVESSARLTLGMFVVTAVLCSGVAVVMPGFADIAWPTLVSHRFLGELVPLIGLTTLLAFLLMTAYQPKVDPTRAAVIYLGEPLVGAAFAWLHNGRHMSDTALAGACLILLANGIAEWKWPRV